MGATVRDFVVREANTSHYFVGYDDQGQDLHWYFNVGLKVFVKLMIDLILILAHIVGSNVVVIGFLPSINFLLSIKPNLRDRFYSLFKSCTGELLKHHLNVRW